MSLLVHTASFQGREALVLACDNGVLDWLSDQFTVLSALAHPAGADLSSAMGSRSGRSKALKSGSKQLKTRHGLISFSKMATSFGIYLARSQRDFRTSCAVLRCHTGPATSIWKRMTRSRPCWSLPRKNTRRTRFGR